MSLKFGWYKTPVPGDREDKKIPHARIISQGTLDTKYMCKMISMSSTISSADVKGVLEALNFWMGFHLAEGNSIELDGLGYFTPTLKSRTVTDENGKAKVIGRSRHRQLPLRNLPEKTDQGNRTGTGEKGENRKTHTGTTAGEYYERGE